MTTELQLKEVSGSAWMPALEAYEYTPRHGLSRRTLTRACEYIERHLGEELTLSGIARVAGMSRFHFARLFRVSTGHSPMAYLLRKRIERAKSLLDRGDLAICEIAAMLGFSDQSHFSRTFRKLEGTTPKQFARAARNR
jgi:AraC family transcriptional regulator